jgi:transcriptional regulator with XRE-family HTH domain
MKIIDATPEQPESEQINSGVEMVSSGLSSRDFNLKTAELIKSQIGDVEEVRKSLGLSQRKMCQLLLIDPSTWSRWATGKTEPPPYVFRMLQWGLAVMERYPETHPLANYEKFEQLKKSEELSKRLSQIEDSLVNKPEDKEGLVTKLINQFRKLF